MLTARSALAQANQFWGGAGFVLVPHHGPDVSPNVMRLLQAYDPDYVVAHRVGTAFNTMSEVVRADVALACSTYRRWLPGPGEDEAATSAGGQAGSPEGGQAGGLLGYGPPVPRWNDGASDWNLDEAFMNSDSEGPLTPLASFGDDDRMCLHAPSELGGALALAVTAKVGAVREPAAEPTLELDEAQARQVVEWLLAPNSGTPDLPNALVYHPGDLALGVVPGSMAPAWERTQIGLARLLAGMPLRPVRHLVVGDGADDFALYLMLDRLYGEAVWIHSDWSPLVGQSTAADETAHDVGKAALEATIQSALRRQAWAAGRGSCFEVVVTSATIAVADLESYAAPESPLHIAPIKVGFVADDVDGESGRGAGDAGATDVGAGVGTDHLRQGRPHHVISIRESVAVPERGRLHYGLAKQFEIRDGLPARVNEFGGLALISALNVVMPEDPVLSSNGQLTWQVDVSFDALTSSETGGGVRALVGMPSGRRLDGHALVPSEEEAFDSWVRSARAGISFDSRKYGWVGAGSSGAQRVARPRLQQLDLASWVETMARQNGFETEISDTGMRAELLARLWGGRAVFSSDMQGPVKELVALFLRTGANTRRAYPEGYGVLLHGSKGVLNVKGVSAPWMSASASEAPVGAAEAGVEEEGPTVEGAVDDAAAADPGVGEMPEHARRFLDSLLTRRILTRGLVIGCRHCRDVAFVAVDELGQTNTCSRCGGQTELSLDAWRDPISDPSWHYDIHPVMRDFVVDHGDAVLTLGAYLAGRSRTYEDVGETNLLRPGSRRPVAEADLVAHADGRVLTAEVKTSDDLDSKKDRRMAAAVKRVLWARVVAADEIILATTQKAWKQASIDAMKTVLREADRLEVWTPGLRPRLRLISGLGTSDLSDEPVEVF